MYDSEYYDCDQYCPDCFMNASALYQVSHGRYVCRCSPLYPDLRPGDLSFTKLACSCDVVYEFLGMEWSGNEIVCKCSSPDLFALLERQHILGVNTNLRGEIVREDPLLDLLKWRL